MSTPGPRWIPSLSQPAMEQVLRGESCSLNTLTPTLTHFHWLRNACGTFPQSIPQFDHFHWTFRSCGTPANSPSPQVARRHLGVPQSRGRPTVSHPPRRPRPPPPGEEWTARASPGTPRRALAFSRRRSPADLRCARPRTRPSRPRMRPSRPRSRGLGRARAAVGPRRGRWLNAATKGQQLSASGRRCRAQAQAGQAQGRRRCSGDIEFIADRTDWGTAELLANGNGLGSG
jgi:hypothetical protein